MKKSKLIFTLSIFLILSIYALQNALSQTADNSNPYSEDAKKILDAKEQIEKLKENETRNEFLKKQWGEFLSKNEAMGSFLNSLNKTSPVLNPLLRYTIGIGPSLTFVFFLTLSIWIALVSVIYRTTNLFSILSKRFHIILSFGFVIIISIIGITNAIAEVIINLIEKISIWQIKLIIIVIIMAMLIISVKFSKLIEKYAEQEKKKKEEEIAREKLKSGSKVAEVYAKKLGK